MVRGKKSQAFRGDFPLDSGRTLINYLRGQGGTLRGALEAAHDILGYVLGQALQNDSVDAATRRGAAGLEPPDKEIEEFAGRLESFLDNTREPEEEEEKPVRGKAKHGPVRMSNPQPAQLPDWMGPMILGLLKKLLDKWI